MVYVFRRGADSCQRCSASLVLYNPLFAHRPYLAPGTTAEHETDTIVVFARPPAAVLHSTDIQPHWPGMFVRRCALDG